MSIEQIMTPDPACGTPDTSLREVAQMMLEHDCGEIPIVEDNDSKRVVGVITDRDIAVRAVASGMDGSASAANVMSRNVVTVRENADVQEACDKMEQNQIRRVPVVDAQGRLCGIVAQADIALHLNEQDAGTVVKDVSRRSPSGPSLNA